MRILVVSDSHGRWGCLLDVINKQPTAELVIHLGDGAGDVTDIMTMHKKPVVSVEGNCDFCTSAPPLKLIEAGGKKIFATHGHLYGVKKDTRRLSEAARERGADICLYGHTHTAELTFEDGLYIINPGSIAVPRDGKRSYATIDITDSGIAPNIVYI